jgi:hypothetical protein
MRMAEYVYLKVAPTGTDFTGKKIGLWTVVGLVSTSPRYWHCVCACGRNRLVAASSLGSGSTTKCGSCGYAGYRGVCVCGEHAYAELTNGYVTMVEPKDAKFIQQRKWSAKIDSKSRSYVSVVGSDNRRLAREILAVTDPCAHVDHIDNNPLNNRRQNLRICAPHENSMNQRAKKGCTSRFKGVHFRKKKGSWVSRITVCGERRYIGEFLSEEEAARAYDAEAIRLHGEFARTNASLGLFDK